MNLRKKSVKELRNLAKEYRPEAVSQLFFIFALIASALLSEALSIVHEYVKESHRSIYDQWAWVVVILGILFAIGVMLLAYLVSVRDLNKVIDEIDARSARTKKSRRKKS